MSRSTLRSLGQVLVLFALAALVLAGTSLKELTTSSLWDETSVEIGQPNTSGCESTALYYDQASGQPLVCRNAGLPPMRMTGERQPSQADLLARQLGGDGIFSENDRAEVQRVVDEQIANRPAAEQQRLDEWREQNRSDLASWWVASGALILALVCAGGAWTLLTRATRADVARSRR